ncbi:MAG: peptidase S8, partial [Candidatus Electrothrix sp. AUS4]|nr:peptidase S8 [Candidatus Electrothrix sp. AUS4]
MLWTRNSDLSQNENNPYKEESVKRVWLKRLSLLHAAALILSVGLISAAVSPVLAQPPDMVKVLIGFDIQPGPAEEALVHGKGGTVKYTYHLVPAIAATLPAQAREALLRNPNVIAVDDDLAVHAIDEELDNTWGVKRIGAGTVHDDGNKGYGVKVGILDSGIDTDHPDLTYDPACSANFVDSETLEDGAGHGTHTAGTVAALDNDTGVVGVAPEVTLCIYKVLDSNGSGSYSDVIAALEQAVDDGVQVTNNSYGSTGDPGAIVKAAFDNAYAAGVLNIGSAGNNGTADGTGDNCGYPARWDSVVATAATTQSDVRASFSSTCPEVELAAPGYYILSTVPGGGYGYKSGTSMAS